MQGKYVVPKYSKSALAGDWVLMWQDTGAVFRLHLGEDLQFETVKGVGSGQLGGRWNLWGADRFVPPPPLSLCGRVCKLSLAPCLRTLSVWTGFSDDMEK